MTHPSNAFAQPRHRSSSWPISAALLVWALIGNDARRNPPARPSSDDATALAAAPEGYRFTADHSKFKELKGPFTSGSEVTKACLSCHTEAGKQVMGTRHWTWESTNPATGQQLGK